MAGNWKIFHSRLFGWHCPSGLFADVNIIKLRCGFRVLPWVLGGRYILSQYIILAHNPSFKCHCWIFVVLPTQFLQWTQASEQRSYHFFPEWKVGTASLLIFSTVLHIIWKSSLSLGRHLQPQLEFSQERGTMWLFNMSSSHLLYNLDRPGLSKTKHEMGQFSCSYS